MSERPTSFLAPVPDPTTEPFWQACREHRLLITRCSSCGRAHHYPRPFCPRCGSDEVAWEQASGHATLYSWSVVHRNDMRPFDALVPYIAALVDLAEGPRMMTRIVDAAPEELVIDMPVHVTWITEAEITVPMFTPTGGANVTPATTSRPGAS